MNIFIKEAKSFAFQTILWTIILLTILLLFIPLYPAVINNRDSIYEIYSTFSKDTLLFFGIDLNNLFTPLGVYAFLFNLIIILGALEAGIVGLKIMNNDRIEHASSFLLTKPITRKKILVSKFSAGIVSLTVTNLIYQIASIIILLLSSTNVIWYELILINLALYFIQITFLTITMAIGTFIKKIKVLSITSVVVVLCFYFLSVIEKLIKNPILRYINPFSYFKIQDILENGFYNTSFIVATIFITFFCLNFSFIYYENSDIIEEVA